MVVIMQSTDTLTLFNGYGTYDGFKKPVLFIPN